MRGGATNLREAGNRAGQPPGWEKLHRDLASESGPSAEARAPQGEAQGEVAGRGSMAGP